MIRAGIDGREHPLEDVFGFARASAQTGTPSKRAAP
jgi:hypothetical protein